MKAEKIRSGQNGPYTDTVEEWDVTAENGESEQQALDWCKKNLEEVTYEYDEWSKKQFDDINVHFAGYYEFTDKGNGNYSYKVVTPYSD